MNFHKSNNINDFNLNSFSCGLTHTWLKLVSNTFGNDIKVPLMVCKGELNGPTFGLTALVHGDELNGLSVIQKVFDKIDYKKLSGTIVAIPIVNVPGFLRKERNFSDGRDLNHKFPGKENGGESSIYAFNVFEKVIKKLDYLLDLHTAKAGNINSFYVRANLKNEKIKEISLLLDAQIILNSEGGKGTLRRQANDHGVLSITLELGNPSIFEKEVISRSIQGIFNCLIGLEMLDGEILLSGKPVICNNSYRIQTSQGGIMEVLPELTSIIEKGEKIAIIKDVFGEVIKEYFSSYSGIVIGKNISPINNAGSRIMHLGKLKN